MSNELETSTLPPLKKTNNNTSEPSMEDIKNRVMNLYPSFQKIERQIIEIKQQIPSGLNRELLTLQKETQTVLDSFYGTETEALSSELKKKFDDLGQQFDSKIDHSFDEFKIELKNRIDRNRLINPPNISAKISHEDEKRLQRLESMFDSHQKKTQQKLNLLEREISNLLISNINPVGIGGVHNIELSIEKNNAIIDQLDSKLTIIEQSIDEMAKAINKSYQDKETEEKKQEIIVDEDPIAILDEVEQSINEYEKELLSKVEALENQKNAYDQVIAELETITNSSKEKIMTLESTINQLEVEGRELEMKAQKFAQDESIASKDNSLQILLIDASSKYNVIKQDLSLMQDQIRKIEFSIPIPLEKSK